MTLSSGAILITRVGERSDGEKVDIRIPGDLVISTNGYHDGDEEYDEYEEDAEEDTGRYDMSFEDSNASRRGEEMTVDEQED